MCCANALNCEQQSMFREHQPRRFGHQHHYDRTHDRPWIGQSVMRWGRLIPTSTETGGRAQQRARKQQPPRPTIMLRCHAFVERYVWLDPDGFSTTQNNEGPNATANTPTRQHESEDAWRMMKDDQSKAKNQERDRTRSNVVAVNPAKPFHIIRLKFSATHYLPDSAAHVVQNFDRAK